MKEFDFLNTLNVSESVKHGLASNLHRVTEGNPTVLVAPIAKKRSPESILKGWDGIYSSNKDVLNNVLNELEESQRSKYGPRSRAIPWVDLTGGVEKYFSAESANLTPPTVPQDARRNLRPVSLQNAMNRLKNSTNSGLPYYRRKGSVKETTAQNFEQLLARKDPCVIFIRTQEGYKTRVVWGYPMADTLNEMRFYVPLLDYQRKTNYRNALLTPDAVDRKMTSLIDFALRGDGNLLSIDFSAYDTSLKTTLQSAAFNYIKTLFQPQYDEELNYISARFNTIGLITPSGVRSGPHGVPSGSTFTNEVDSIAQFLIAREFGLDPVYFDIQGDDGAYCVSDPDALKRAFTSYGLEVNDEKSYIAEDYLVYLQNLYHNDYRQDGIVRGIYPTYRALSRIVYLERFNDFSGDDISGSDYFSIRTIAILENCRNHPLHEQLVKYVLSLDKYNLSYSDRGLRSYVQRMSESSGVAGILNNQIENTVSGIKDFKTVEIIRRLTAE